MQRTDGFPEARPVPEGTPPWGEWTFAGLDDIEEGMGSTPHVRIVDRRAAILRALAIARPDDTILLAGKGHETYQVVGHDHVPLDERAIVAEAVGAAAGASPAPAAEAKA